MKKNISKTVKEYLNEVLSVIGKGYEYYGR